MTIYFFAISFVAMALTVYDKIAAKKNSRRISEKTLLTVGILGGALVMYCVMKIIHHKTRHAKFMILLPLVFLFQIVFAYVITVKIVEWGILARIL